LFNSRSRTTVILMRKRLSLRGAHLSAVAHRAKAEATKQSIFRLAATGLLGLDVIEPIGFRASRMMRLDEITTSHRLRRAAMIDHTGIGVADVGRSATFYDAVLEALGMRRVMQMPDKVGTDGVGYGFDYPVFWIDRYHPHSVKQHTAFAARTRAEVDAFHAAALKAGGTENGAPGLRRPNYYAAYVLDPDGNNIEAVFRGG
jgi:catechol 2,3-dioxygenase-like lactoylglutathione lyase family enzyme